MGNDQTTRWLAGQGARGDDYDARFAALEAAGHDMHGEADLVMSFAPRTVLDAGCGTGRVAIELARRGVDAVGVDLDPSMLEPARRKAPALDWRLGDLATVELGRSFDLVVLAGNVMIFLAQGSERRVLANLARHLRPDGLLVAGFQLQRGGLTLEVYDAHAAAARLVLTERWATWDRQPWRVGGDYAVSVHRLATAGA